MKAAIYCRVSTEDQGKEGTSLQSQRAACLDFAASRNLEVVRTFSEIYSGLSLERPGLNELREFVRKEQIDVIVCYCLDRLSRDPGHGVILTQELEKHSVKLETVTEDIDNSELGKLITYIRGFASKLEAEKIRERTMRGKRTKAAMGRMVGGCRLYGYIYIPTKQENGSRRIIKDDEAAQVRQMFHWLVNEQLSTYAITFRLRVLQIPTPSGRSQWNATTVRQILTNVAYTGKTYAFTQTHTKETGFKHQPRENWIEIPGATPPIISEELFNAAQEQLKRNKELSPRNSKAEYLLRGRVYCKQCSRVYWGFLHTGRFGDKTRRYKCSGKYKIVTPITCPSAGQDADRLESLVWGQVEALLSKPETVIAEMFKRQKEVIEGTTRLDAELKGIEAKISGLRSEQERLCDLYMMGFDSDLTKIENGKINAKRKLLEDQKANIEKRIEAQKNSTIEYEEIQRFCRVIRENMKQLSFADKVSILDSLKVKVWIDGNEVYVSGCIPLTSECIANTPS